MKKQLNIIGGGIAGCYLALKLQKKFDVTLFEINSKLMNGNPYCHLHLGGMLYPEINIEQSIELAKNSLKFIEVFPECIDYRPTVIMYHSESPYSVNIQRCQEIGKLIDNYYAVYEEKNIDWMKRKIVIPVSNYHDIYVNQVLQNCTLPKVKFPFISVLEYGIDQNKVSEKIVQEIEKTDIKVRTNTVGIYSEQLTILTNDPWSLYETKANYEYLTSVPENFPELVIVGERGTNNGSIQITPVGRSKMIIHIMNNKACLFNGKFVSTEKRIKYVEKTISKIIPFFSNALLEKVNICQQQLNQNSSQRTSHAKIEQNIIKICLIKAISIVELAETTDYQIQKHFSLSHANQEA
eukprot:TRINITY_DN12626_c0_g1_i1.p1 TRINITY_DN12626_c0_g1~~TRINITY_DN12626_c0_g1_i1.p1  ORF type:complete len:352 (-),score=8.39 TRINITY_DN12626_c0_g1_i1:57-1112(-)